MSLSMIEIARQRVRRPLVLARLRRAGIVLGAGVTVVGDPVVSLAQRGSISIGHGSTLISSSRWTALGVGRPVILRTLLPGAKIMIGENVGLSGTTICAAKEVTVGDRVMFGADVLVFDTDFHPLETVPRRGLAIPAPMPEDRVTIGADAFIGARALILKGVTVGAGAVVGAGSVVTDDVPSGAIVGGAPARFIRWLGYRNQSAEGVV